MRPNQMKKGGGFLDGVDGVWEDYQFTDEFNGEPFTPGKIPSFDGKGKIDKPHTLNLFITFKVDGAEEPTTTTIKLANDYDKYAVSDDGHVLSMADDSDLDLNQNTAGGKFIRSLQAANFPIDDLDDDPKTLDLQPCLGRRYRLVQRVDEERTKKYGLKKDKKNPGKAYERKDLIIDQYYGDEEQTASPAATKAASKPNGKVSAPAKGKKAAEPTLEDLAKETLVSILQENNGGPMATSKLSQKTLLKLGKHPQREDVRKLCFDVDFLTGDDAPWTYDKAKKTVAMEVEEASE